MAVVSEDSAEVTTSPSTKSSIAGSLFAFAAIILLASMTLHRFQENKPAISEVVLAGDKSNSRYTGAESRYKPISMPPVAFTISSPNYTEGELLDYVWPVFEWNEIKNGFSNRTNNATFLSDHEVQFGSDACEWKGGYNKFPNITGKLDSGPSTWPVFCIKNNERPLTGRFGDPLWSFLSFSLYKCGSKVGNLTDSLKDAWKRDGKFNGECAPDPIGKFNVGATLGLNIWFQFPTEDFAKGADLVTDDGQGQVGSWTWWIYEVLNPANPAPMLTIDLRHNTALINDPIWSDFQDGPHRTLRWFDWNAFEHTPSGTSSQMFESGDAPLVFTSFRVAWMRREVSVRYMTWQEMLSEVSGSWTFSLIFGAGFAMIFEYFRNEEANEEAIEDDEEEGEQKQTRVFVLKTDQIITKDELELIISEANEGEGKGGENRDV